MNYPNFMPTPQTSGNNNNYGMSNNPIYPQSPMNNMNIPTIVQPQQQQQIPQSQNNFCGINGKFVESKAIVDITEIPGGGYGVFPRADLQEIYVKTWNKNGLTDVVSYVPKIEEAPSQKEPTNMQVYGALEEHIKRLESKLDSIVSSFNNTNSNKEKGTNLPPTKEINF